MALIKSVSGVRGITRADDPADITMNEDVARRMGRAYATYLMRERSDGDAPTLVGGRDGRATGATLLQAFADGAAMSGVRMVDLGVVTTPGIAMMVKHLAASGGVVITASHNPSEWNGLKLMTPAGCAPPKADAETIFGIFDRDDFLDRKVTGDSGAAAVDPHEHHVAAVLATVDVESIRRCKFSVVLDSINGAGATAGRMLLERLGCQITHINAEPADVFAHTPEPIAANLGDLCDAVRSASACVGFAQDPDADRLALVDENGRFIGEEYTLALCAMRVLTTHPGPVAVNLSTSRMIDDIAASAGGPCTVHRSAVGEANVVEAMHKHRCVFGGEGNGGVIDPRVVYVRDSIVAMALVLDLMAAEDATMSQLTDRLTAYATIKEKITCDASAIEKATGKARESFADGVINDIDGVRIDWPDEKKWVHVRGSNTEPILRIIVEAPDRAAAEQLMSRARQLVGN